MLSSEQYLLRLTHLKDHAEFSKGVEDRGVEVLHSFPVPGFFGFMNKFPTEKAARRWT